VTRVPGKPGWIFDKTGIYRKVATRKGADGDADEPPRYDQLTDWAPTVERYVVGKTVEGETIRTRYTVQVGDQTQTFSQDDLRDGRAWDNFHQAAGQGDRQVAGALADIVRLLGRDLGETVDCPMWEGDRLVMPPADLMPSGYEQTGHEMSAELLGIACDNPKLALVLGFSSAAPYVAPLDRQAFVVHLPGTAGQGKTTGMWAAASLWGRPCIGGSLIPSWNTTANGPYARVGRLAVVPAFYDDLHAAGFTPDQLKKLIFGLTQGGSRQRSDRNGEERRSRYWSGVLFSTGNNSILGMLGTVGEVARRVVEIPSPIVKNGPTADAVKLLAQKAYGTWRPAASIATMREVVEWAEAKLTPILGPDPSGVSIGIMRCVALGVAGAALLGGQDLGQAALDAAREVLANQVVEAIEAGATTGEKFLEAARQMVVSRSLYPTRAERRNLPSDRPKPEIHGFYEAPDLYVMTTRVQAIAELAGLNDAQVALRELKAAGHLVTQPNARQLRRQFRMGTERFDVYHIRFPGDSADPPPIESTSPDPFYMESFTSVTSVTSVSAGQTAESLTLPISVTAPTSVTAGQTAGSGSDTASAGVSVTAPTSVTAGQTAGSGSDTASAGVSVTAPTSVTARHAADLADQLRHFRKALATADAFTDLSDADAVAALKTFGVALDGLSFAGPPARVGQLLFEKLTAQYARIPTLDAPPDQPVNAGDVQTMFNFLDQSVDVTAHRYVVGLDVNAQFLAASGVELGTGEPRPMVLGPDQLVAELKLPGYVQLGQPYKVGPRCTLAAGQWIANPMAVYLAQRGGLAVADGWVWPEHRRWLNAWKSAMLRARKDLMAREDLPSRLALVALKSVYAAFLGGWMNSGEDKGGHNKTHTLRPDWMHMVHSTARANALRALDKASVAPFATLADAAYFLVDDPMDPKGLTLSTQPGKWKAHRIGRTTDTTWTTNRRTGKAVGTTLAELVERGQLGSISEAIQHLDEIYRGAVSA
jgi:hypothetical protein